MVILFNSAIADKRRLRLTCTSASGGSASVSRPAVLTRMPTDMRACSWTQYVAICAVSPDPTSFSISRRVSKRQRRVAEVTHTFGHYACDVLLQVPYRVAIREQFGVVACFSPLFYFERWQVLLLALETYRQFGVDHQVYYIQSMLSAVREIMKVRFESLAHFVPLQYFFYSEMKNSSGVRVTESRESHAVDKTRRRRRRRPWL